MHIPKLKYGLQKIEMDLGDDIEPEALSPHFEKPVSDAADIIRDALDNPIDSSCLKDIVSSGETVAIIASDTTRSTGSHIFLPIIVKELNASGIPDTDIDIIIALGIHRMQTEDEHRRLLGGELYERIRPVDHDADNDLFSCGKTSRGTEVSINHHVADADRVILTGAVSPHYFAGFGGGRKSIMPGICSVDAALTSHLLVFNPAPAHGRNPNARTAHLSGNPVHEDMLEAAKIVNPDFMLNTVVTPEKELSAAFSGNFVTAHEAACAYYLENFSVIVSDAADLTIVSCGGYPKDINFIQAHKAIHAGYAVTKPDGWMIVLAECRDGFGYPGFIDWFKFDNTADFEKALRAEYHIYGQTAYAAFEKAMSVNIVLVSELPASDVRRMNMIPAQSFESAYAIAGENLVHDPVVYVIPGASSALFLTKEEHKSALASIIGDY
jgi:nickel-dependent lactate racemase